MVIDCSNTKDELTPKEIGIKSQELRLWIVYRTINHPRILIVNLVFY